MKTNANECMSMQINASRCKSIQINADSYLNLQSKNDWLMDGHIPGMSKDTSRDRQHAIDDSEPVCESGERQHYAAAGPVGNR